MQRERREAARYEVELPLSFSGNEIAGGGIVTSLSKEGCAVKSEESVPPHSFIALRVQLPDPNAPLKVEVAHVRWSNVSTFGLEFIHLHAEEQERLHRFIIWLQTTQNN
jgi:c-di-GMP-binding flagellar brake protein YcgR